MLRLEGWGHWDGGVSTAFARQAAAACRGLASPAEIVPDATELKPQGDDGQGALRVMMR